MSDPLVQDLRDIARSTAPVVPLTDWERDVLERAADALDAARQREEALRNELAVLRQKPDHVTREYVTYGAYEDPI